MARKTATKKTAKKTAGKTAARKTASKKTAAPAAEQAEAATAAGQAAEPASGDTETPRFELAVSRHFDAWLAGQGTSLAFTTYQASKLFLIGRDVEHERLSVAERTIERCMGLAAAGDSLYVASRWQIWRFENALGRGQAQDGYDRIYVPKASHVTGAVDCHEMAVDVDGRLLFVNTLFSCLARLSRDYSFQPVWRPRFVSDLKPEDRCHLNGLALENGIPRFVTAVAASDAAEGWREHRRDGGVVIDLKTGETACEGLSMPHSPRLVGRTLWLLESGTGWLGRVDLRSRTFERVAFCPGYARGMAIVGNFAVVALSKARDRQSFGDLELDAALAEHELEPRCGLLVVELTSGRILHWLRIEGVVEEIFDVAALPGAVRPRAVGFVSDEIERLISLPPAAFEQSRDAGAA